MDVNKLEVSPDFPITINAVEKIDPSINNKSLSLSSTFFNKMDSKVPTKNIMAIKLTIINKVILNSPLFNNFYYTIIILILFDIF